ncbi:MAG: prolyl oligopeptidase family serine peptidase [Actinomycetaceae bacterium]|nr:prolyl oligopeptidase family serine peptidase [Actinomycetaceae bacterium]
MSEQHQHPAIQTSEIGPIAEKRDYQRRFHGYCDTDPWRWLDIPDAFASETNAGDDAITQSADDTSNPVGLPEGERSAADTTGDAAADEPAPSQGLASTPELNDAAAVRALVEAENQWTELNLSSTKDLQTQIVEEIRAHTQLTDVSAPVQRGEYWYYSRTNEASDYETHHRVHSVNRPALDPFAPAEGEQTLLDEPQRAAGQEFYSVENFTLSPSGNLLAWSEDTTGGELFDLKIRDLNSGEIIDEQVRSIAYGIALTDRHVWYARTDEAWRQHQIWVHRIGEPAETDRLIAQEPDALFQLMVELSRDGKWIVITTGSSLTRKVWICPSDDVYQPRLVTAAEHGVRYLVEIAGDHLAIVHNRLSEDETLSVATLPSRDGWLPAHTPVGGQSDPNEGVAPGNSISDVPEARAGNDVDVPGGQDARGAVEAVDEIAPAHTWVDALIPASGERLLKCDSFKDFALLTMRSQGQTALRILHRHEPAGQIPLTHGELGSVYAHSTDVEWPLEARVIEPGANPQWDTDRVRFCVESMALAPTWADWIVNPDPTSSANPVTPTSPTNPASPADPVTPAETAVPNANAPTALDHPTPIEVIKTTNVPGFNPQDYQVRREWVTASDGTRIPVSMVMRKDLTPDGTNPGLIYGYGSYEISMDPWFSRPRLSLLERGVVYAMAHIRGGGEMGRQWYEDGKFAAKTNTFTDFVAVAQWLQESGWVARGRLAAEGGSAGGLLMGAVANLAPATFRAVVAAVPFVDALNTILDPAKPLTVGEWEEWGNPIESREIFEVMRSYSPYDNVRPDVAYPSVLALTSLNDIRVSFVEPLKWVQQLRDSTRVGADNPVLCRLETVAGHAGGSGRTKAWEDYALKAAFILTQLGCEE